MSQQTAVILDKDQSQRDKLRTRLTRCGVMPICFQDELICLENIHHIRPGFVIVRTGSYERASRFVNLSKAIRSNLPVIVLSNKNGVERFIRNNWLVNLFFLRYPANDKEFQRTISLLATVKHDGNLPVLIAGSPERIKLMQGLPLLGLSREPILIQGERGVGKKLIAEAIHGFSASKTTPLEFIDARDITGQWIRKTRERFETLRNYTGCPTVNVVENIENLTFSIQSQLLLLMDGFNRNEAGYREDRTSAPFIALTGDDLERRAQKGLFRKDLYHRLSVLKLTVPPLKGHSEDIRAMAEFFAAFYSIRRNGAISRLPGDVMSGLLEYHWPGNVPELKRSIEHLVMTNKATWTRDLPTLRQCEAVERTDQSENYYSENYYIDAKDVRNYLKQNSDISLKKTTARYAIQVEKKIMKAALAQTNGNCKKAAGLLNISYKSMLNKVKAYHLV